ncbi:hypothetical protein RBSH_01232 [Rhodopirellula baltica SH28]|uniref:HEAT repeat domain-containing protein n=1 Tax=Rhodopirellula baltica SH28 TaxID=993517 RepID=K5DLT2_RHOBT|nr:hypothetical protein [Rhodopirellula baltica]EKK03428.1 hypothetical protein RBSH_01232 [Rhodopirellula baltica SH28]
MTKESMTAAELMAELASDPEYQRKMREKEEARQKKKQVLIEHQKELIAECGEVGVNIKSVWDLVNTSESYHAAIPVLVDHLHKDHESRTIQGIVRALTTHESRGVAFDALVRLFKSTAEGTSELKWLIGAALAESATASDVDVVINLANDESHGRGREFLPLGLIIASKESVLPILQGWTNDPELSKSAKKAIKLLR